MSHRRIAALLVALIATATASIAVPAVAVDDVYAFVGTVHDPLGRPLDEVSVSDGPDSTLTGADGTYRLPENSPGTYGMGAGRADTTYETAEATLLVPGERTVDFTLSYLAGVFPADPTLSAAGGAATTAVTVTATVPDPTASCAVVVDGRTGRQLATSPLAPDVDGSPRWEAALTVPPATAEGIYTLAGWVEDCASDVVLTATDDALYLVDNTAPELSRPAPTGWVGSTPTIRLTATDGLGFIDPGASTLQLDEAPIPFSFNHETGWLMAHPGPLGDGLHHVRAVVADEAGNRTSLTFAFTVDAERPDVADPAPTGTVSARSPTLSVRATDVGAGIDVPRIMFVLSNGVLSSTLRPTYDPASEIASYQVADIPRGVALGEFPLPDGTYTVLAVVTDVAGNASQVTWTFTVRTLT